MTGRIDPDGEWDAGDMGCGDLVLELHYRIAAPPVYFIRRKAERS